MPAIVAALGTALLLAAAAWLVVGELRQDDASAGRALRVVLIDASESSVGRDAQWGTWARSVLATEARGAAEARDALAVVVFGATVRRIFGPGEPEACLDELSARGSEPLDIESVDVGRDASDLASALAAVHDLATRFDADSGDLVIVGDGSYTGADPDAAMSRIAALGLAPRWTAMPRSTRSECGVGALRAPRTIEQGAPLLIACELFWSPADATPASVSSAERETLSLDLCIARGVELEFRRVPVRAPAGAISDERGVVRWWHAEDLGPARAGVTDVAAALIPSRVSSSAPRCTEELASRRTRVRTTGTLVVGVCGESPEDVVSWTSLAGADAPGLAFVPVAPRDVASSLSDLDLLMTIDVDPRSIDVGLVSSFVEHGGSWLAWLGLDAVRGSDDLLARHIAIPLPLTPIEPDSTPRDVILMIDGSGSMAGEPYAGLHAPLAELLGFLAPSDAIEMYIFAGELGPPVPLLDAGRRGKTTDERRAAVDRLYSARAPGGPTALFGSLEALAAQRSKTGRESLIVLMSDGREEGTAQADPRARSIVADLARARARLLVVATGPDADRARLAMLEPSGGIVDLASFDDEAGRAELRKRFARELHRDRLREGIVFEVRGTSVGEALQSLGADLARAFESTPRTEWPALTRYVRARSTLTSETLWSSESGDPVLAVQRVGKGAAAALALDAHADWIQSWPGSRDMLIPLVRQLARGSDQMRDARTGQRASALSAKSAAGELVVSGLPAALPVELHGRLLAKGPEDADIETARVVLLPPSSTRGAVDTRRAALPESPGMDPLNLELSSSDASGFRALVPIAREPAPESVWPRRYLSQSRTELAAPPASRRTGPTVAAGALWLLAASVCCLTFAGVRSFFVSGRA